MFDSKLAGLLAVLIAAYCVIQVIQIQAQQMIQAPRRGELLSDLIPDSSDRRLQEMTKEKSQPVIPDLKFQESMSVADSERPASALRAVPRTRQMKSSDLGS